MDETDEDTGEGHNQPKDDKLVSFVERVENIDEQIVSQHMDYMKAKKVLIADRNTILGEAKQEGIPKKSLKSAVEERASTRKVRKMIEDLEDDDRYYYDRIQEAFERLAAAEPDEAPAD